MRLLLLFFVGVCAFSQEVAEIPYDLVYSLAVKFGPDSVAIRQIIPTDDFAVNLTHDGVVIEPILVQENKFITFKMMPEHVGKNYFLTTNQPKNSMTLSVITEHIDFSKLVGQGGVFPADQFRKYFAKNRAIIKELAETLKVKDNGMVNITFVSRNYKIFSATLDGKEYRTENGCLDIPVKESDFDASLDLVFDKADINFVSSSAIEASHEAP